MFYHPSKDSNSNSHQNQDKIDLEKTARLCWLDMFSNQTLNNIHVICLFCNKLSFEPITTFLYSQHGEKIYKQNTTLCQQCLNDFEDFQVGFISREQYALDVYDHEHGISAELQKKPKLTIADFDIVALQDITHVCISRLCEKAGVVIRTFEPTLSAVLAPNNYRMMYKNNEIGSLSSADREQIKVVCERDEPLDIYQICKELFNSNNAEVRQFFYHRKGNIDSRFKPLWKIRYDLQQLLGE